MPRYCCWSLSWSSNSYDWRLLTIEAKASRLAAFLSAHYHGVVWYDDIEVREKKTPP